MIAALTRFFYKTIGKPFLFLFDPYGVHKRTVALGERLGRCDVARRFFVLGLGSRDPILAQIFLGVRWESPIGLAAGFDYEARLTGILPSIGFGFGSVGTLTNRPYGGNAKPMLGRLVKSRSLMVNKGFKNDGVGSTLERLKGSEFSYPVGVSIGTSNDGSVTGQVGAVQDIVSAFTAAESSRVSFAYYELNISCPNLSGAIDFYTPSRFEALLSAIEGLRLGRPLFVKMPIAKTDGEIAALVEVIVRYSFVKGVILGNLQTDRKHPALIKEEVDAYPVGNFSGLPCRDRSDELIRFIYRRFGSKIKIIGCGGVFSPDDAYRKIAFGASLVQLITGMIFEGPQLVAEINRELAKRLTQEGYGSVAELVGTAAR